MPATARWGLRYDPATGVQPNGPLALQHLAEDVENKAMPIVGLKSDLASHNPVTSGSCRTFFATDTGEYFVSDGTAWRSVWMDGASEMQAWKDFPGGGIGQISTSASPGGVAGTLYYMERIVSGNNFAILANGGIYSNARALVHYNTADHSIAGKTTQLRVCGVVIEQSTPTGVTFTFGMHPISSVGVSSGTGGHPTPIANDTASGNTVGVSTGAQSMAIGRSTPFTIPATGVYMMMVRLSGACATGSRARLGCWMEMRHV